MREQAPRRRGACVAAAAVAALLAGCGSADHPSTRSASASPARTAASHHPPPVWKKMPRTVAAVGDSITRGFDACSVLADCPEVSWVTGTDDRVGSLASRLRPKSSRGGHRAGSGKEAGQTVRNSWNLARSGARMSDLPRQIDEAVEKRPDMVAVLMGANDACRSSTGAMTPTAEFRQDFEDSLSTLHKELPDTRVLVASVPDLEHLWQVGRQNPLAKQVWRLGICPSMLSRPDSTAVNDQERRASVGERVDEYNEVLRRSCAKYPSCTFDGGAVHALRFSIGDLSPWDWFHPSVRGQATLARVLYEVAFKEHA
ncbi:SGNH/GDSL hydrolase family protein [Wenjunlia tyrosinilytica]|uniref:Lipoprotein n=1 Tax=Wenjunlia tyrosinilytica TaxID=1544741 RepID=A0A917ZCT2_9ACTN|nr:SGNH/GDSL hydrolase family protein [Wenjunlia tyrosinilytica]GGO80560.1 lipoprotein [Wenjunlia tyrosinilytica]